MNRIPRCMAGHAQPGAPARTTLCALLAGSALLMAACADRESDGPGAEPPAASANDAAAAAAKRVPGDVVIDDTHVYPESITVTQAGVLITGSVKGTLFRAEPDETVARPWVRADAQNELLSVLGVLADEPSDTLWVCSVPSPFPGAPSSQGKASSLMAFDLQTGERKAAYPFPAPASACNDIAIAADGTAFATDTPNGRIFTLAPGADALTLFAQDERLKGVDGIAFSADGTLYVNIVSRGALMRIERGADGKAGALTELSLSQPIAGPDGFRLIEGNRFVLAEGNGGRIDEVLISGDHAEIRVLREGLTSPPGVTPFGDVAYAVEGKIGYLIDPKLKGQDPGTFTIHAIPLEPAQMQN